MPRPSPASIARFLEVMQQRHGLPTDAPAPRPSTPPMTNADGTPFEPLPTLIPED